MKWAMVLVGILVLSMCSSDGSVNTTTAEDAEITTTSTSTTTTTTTILGGGGFPTTTEAPSVAPGDLSGVWWGTKTMGGQTEEGTVLISQTGLTFTLSFSEGFKCRPADACEFDGTIEALENDDGDIMYAWMASNSGRADDQGGTYESFFLLAPFSAYDAVVPPIDATTGEPKDTSNIYWGDGQSIYRADGEEMVWEGSLMIEPFG